MGYRPSASGPAGTPMDGDGEASRWAHGNHSRVFSGGGAVEVVVGGLVSSLRDYVEFLQMLLRGGMRPDGKPIISPRSLEMAVDKNQMSIATDGLVENSIPGHAMAFLGEVVVSSQNIAPGWVSWGGTAGTYFGINVRDRYAVAFFAHAFSAPKA